MLTVISSFSTTHEEKILALLKKTVVFNGHVSYLSFLSFLWFFFQEVTSEAVEKRLQLESYDLGANFSELKSEYGQSKSSLYELFTELKTKGLEPDV